MGMGFCMARQHRSTTTTCAENICHFMLAVQAVTVALKSEVHNNAMISQTALSLSQYFRHILKVVKSDY
jgi:CO dehydrogenase/acetyl-CoA synthase epsilon subunit